MHLLYENWKMRSLIITVIIIITSVLFFLLDQSEWANNIRIAEADGGGHGPEGDGPNIFSAIFGSLLKETVMIGVPMLLAIGIGKIYQKLTNKPA